MIRTAHVTEFNELASRKLSPTYVMTVGSGSMVEKERVKGWVAYASPKLGDDRDFAKWFPNKKELDNWLGSQA